MGTAREQDSLITLLIREQTRVLEAVEHFARAGGASALAETRRILRALDSAETEILFPAFGRVRLRLDMEHLLEDSRTVRAEQLAGLDRLAHKRSAPLRKLAAIELADTIKHHLERQVALMVPVLASQLPRQLYRSISDAFITRYRGELEGTRVEARTAAPKQAAAS